MGWFELGMANPFTQPTVRCAGPNCAHVRKEANHWFVVSTAELEPPIRAFTCFPFMADIELAEDEYPVCGQQCAQKMLEKYLQIGKLEVNKDKTPE